MKPQARRTLLLLAVIAAVALPAGVLRATCGSDCATARTQSAHVPFCSLPAGVRDLIAAGFREDRSPDVLAVTGRAGVAGGTGTGASGLDVPWISAEGAGAARVPIAFAGAGFSRSARLPDGTGLDDVAPTLARVTGVSMPGARAGEALSGFDGSRPRLVLEVAWRGVGSRDLEDRPGAWPYLRSLLREGGGTLGGTTGSLPVDPAATLTTLATGTLPDAHAITGTQLRDAYTGELVRAWTGDLTPAAVSTYADELDRANHQQSVVGLVETDTADRGAIGQGYYVGGDQDSVLTTHPPGSQADAAVRAIRTAGFGSERVTDLLVVVMRGSIHRLDGDTRRVVRAATRAANGSVDVVVAGTGSLHEPARPASAAAIVARVDRAVGGSGPAIRAAGPGGLFLRSGASGHDVASALLRLRGRDGRRMMSDAFPAFAVALGRFC